MSTVVTPSATDARRQSGLGAAVSLTHVSKTFKLPHEQFYTLKERILHPVKSQAFDLLHAVNDVSLDVAPGEFFGIIGRNGSGKSTLLKCIAGIYRKDEGSIKVRGRISPFIELGVGFSPELTARDNVMINAVMLGLSRREARRRFDAIIDFAELHDFLDLRLKNYSSGMLVRLAFSAAIQIETEVLLIDEVLAVGDANFQQKCFDQFKRLKDEGRTILFVTHDMGSVERFCDRAMLLDKGNVIEVGEPTHVARNYNQLNFGRPVQTSSTATEAEDPAKPAWIVDGWFEDPAGQRVAGCALGDLCVAAVEVEFHDDFDDPLFGLSLCSEGGPSVFSARSDYGGHPASGRFAAGSRVVYRARFENWLAPGRYSLTGAVARMGLGADLLDIRDELASLVVHSGARISGMVQLPYTIEIDQQ